MRPILSTLAAIALVLAACSGVLAADHHPPATIRFGEAFKGHRLVNIADKIPSGKNVAWSAHVSKLPATKLTVRLTQTKGPGPHPAVVAKWTVKLSKSAKVLSGMLTAERLKKMRLSHSTFQLAYLAGKTVIAVGSWTRLSCASCGGGNSGTY